MDVIFLNKPIHSVAQLAFDDKQDYRLRAVVLKGNMGYVMSNALNVGHIFRAIFAESFIDDPQLYSSQVDSQRSEIQTAEVK